MLTTDEPSVGTVHIFASPYIWGLHFLENVTEIFKRKWAVNSPQYFQKKMWLILWVIYTGLICGWANLLQNYRLDGLELISKAIGDLECPCQENEASLNKWEPEHWSLSHVACQQSPLLSSILLFPRQLSTTTHCILATLYFVVLNKIIVLWPIGQ